jgi:hexosaminidase
MKKIFLAISLFATLACIAQLNIIPAPNKATITKGNFKLSKATVIVLNNNAEQATANFLNDYLKTYYGFQLKVVAKATTNFISFTTPTFIRKPDNEERYTLNVSPTSIQIQGDGMAGTFYGMQTLLQLLPTTNLKSQNLNLPCVAIEDEPRFAYRGMHLDVSRHFFPISYVKKYIDYIALHKMNYFHWHLTDDQGWRIEIKKYPKLTSVGAWRDGTIIGRFPGTGNDGIKHGGFYTQEQVKEIVRYAADRHITVLPEIEMPGHSMAALAAYPELGTTPTVATKVPMTWGLNGVENNVFAPTEKTFGFLEDVLTEVMDLFPSQMIHIGGDECSKIWWKKDSASQQLMRQKGLKTEDELQSYFIQRIEKFVNSKGKKIIGWDEILEGGLAPNAAVMSWTGEQGGIHAAKQKHDVVMTPGGWCYFDHTQTKNEDSVTIGGFTPLEKVYGYEPVPKELTAEEGKYILGAQANLWTEYVGYPSKVEYMIFPRMSALSEVLWSNKAQRNWEDFERRLPEQIKRYELWKANYSRAYYEIVEQILPTSNFEGIELKLRTKIPNGHITLRMPEQKWDSMDKPFRLDTSKKLILQAFNDKYKTFEYIACNDKGVCSNKRISTFYFNLATGKKITITPTPSPSYPGNGAFTLVDGINNTKGRDRSSEFIGYSGGNAEAIIDLGSSQTINNVTLHAFESQLGWIYRPAGMDVSISLDGITYTNLGNTNNFEIIKDGNGILKINASPTAARFIKLSIKNFGKIPDGKPGAGKGSWMFLDEVEVN